MQSDVCTNQQTGRGKRRFKNRRDAERQARKSTVKLYSYPCLYCDGWHLTHQQPRHKGIAPPSAKTLRGILENQAREIAAFEKRFRKANDRLAAETAAAQKRQSEAEAAHKEELAAIAVMVGRLQWK